MNNEFCEDCEVATVDTGLKVFEKIGDYKKAMKSFVKGLIKTKLYQNEKGDLKLTIDKTFVKKLNFRKVTLTCTSADKLYTSSMTCEALTRVFNRIDPSLFTDFAEQLSRTKNFGKLIVE